MHEYKSWLNEKFTKETWSLTHKKLTPIHDNKRLIALISNLILQKKKKKKMKLEV